MLKKSSQLIAHSIHTCISAVPAKPIRALGLSFRTLTTSSKSVELSLQIIASCPVWVLPSVKPPVLGVHVNLYCDINCKLIFITFDCCSNKYLSFLWLEVRQSQLTCIGNLRPKSERLLQRLMCIIINYISLDYSCEAVGVCGIDLVESIDSSSEWVDLLVGVSHKHLGSHLTRQDVNNGCEKNLHFSRL